MNVLRVKIQGRKDEPLYGLYTESYSKKLPELLKRGVFWDEFLEIRKRYLTIHRIEFIVEAIEEPIPCKGEISPKLVREAEEEAQRKREQNAHKS